MSIHKTSLHADPILHLFQDIFSWPNEELDLHASLFYVLTSIKYLRDGGSMLIRLNLIASKSWSIIFEIVHNLFQEYAFIRPSVLNPFNSEIYLFLDKYEIKKLSLLSLDTSIYQNLYRQRIYQNFYLNYIPDLENPIYQKYNGEIKIWIEKLSEIINNLNDTDKKKSNKINYLVNWHLENNLGQISNIDKYLSNTLIDKPILLALNTKAKNFSIKPILPTGLYDQSFYKKLIEKRAELNYYKRVMDTKPSKIFARSRYNDRMGYLLTWEELNNMIDVYHNLKYMLGKQYKAEMVTNAWIKMYEMLNMFPNLFPSDAKEQIEYVEYVDSLPRSTIKTFHLCEAPGAFISALNHFLSNRNQELNWYAQTLRPTSETIGSDAALEDHFGLIASYPKRWLFGDPKIDDSGDITHSKIIKYYASNSLLRDIDFMTADAGLQCDPSELNEQEAYLGKINMGQIICILACLPPGKSAIFKTFLPMSEPLTISMIYLVTHLFSSVTMVKPSTSHNTNSEIYVVMQGYKGIDKSMLEILYILLDEPKITSKTLLFSQIDKTFFNSYMGNINTLIDRQIQALSRSYYYYYHLEEVEKFKKGVEQAPLDWLRLNPIFTLQNPLFPKI